MPLIGCDPFSFTLTWRKKQINRNSYRTTDNARSKALRPVLKIHRFYSLGNLEIYRIGKQRPDAII